MILDAAAIAGLYRSHGHVVLRRARTLLGTESDAREVLQEVFASLVRTPDVAKLTAALGDGAVVTPAGPGEVYVTGAEAAAIGDAALRAGVPIHQLVTQRPDLEDAFLELTRGKTAIR